MDFTADKITQLYKALLQQGFSFFTFKEYVENRTSGKFIILRHDVEQKYHIALKFARIQYSLGIKGTYYYRMLPKCFKPEIVKQIAELDHEIGYHYDDLAQCKGNHQKAIARFEKNLTTLRSIALVETICMDGSPLSKYDNKDLWKEYDYRSLGIKGEPYFDINFDEVFYLTDTGRRWDGWKASVRDLVPQQEQWVKQGLVFHSTDDIINAANKGYLPNKIMITIHPQRWNDKPFPWIKELLVQNVKNQVKRILIMSKRAKQK